MQLKLKNKSLLCLLICTSLPATSFSADRTWAGNFLACNGNFESSFCWENFENPPGSADTAIFSSSGSSGETFNSIVNFNASTTTNNRVNVTDDFRWSINGNRYNISTSLNVSGSGTFLSFLSTQGNGTFTNNPGVIDIAGILSVTGGASVVNSTEKLEIGNLSVSSNSLFSSAFGVASVGGSLSMIDATSTSVSGNALISGAGAEWLGSSLFVENGRSLIVSNGGYVDVAGPVAGGGSTLTIKNLGRVFTNNGGRIESRKLRVESGSELFSSRGFVGALSVGPGSMSVLSDARVTGADSLWQTDTLSVTDGGLLTVQDDGFVDVASNLLIESSGGVTTRGSFGVDGRIEAGGLRISSNGELESNVGRVGDSLVTGERGVSSMGNATVTGAGSLWDTRSLSVKNSRTLTVANGGFVDVGTGLRISNSGRVTTTGGGRIKASTLGVESGGQLFSNSAFVGSSSTANGSVSAVNGASVSNVGSKWDTGTLNVTNNTFLTISNGGLVKASSTVLEGAASTSVNGVGTQLDTGTLDVTNFSTLSVGSGGFVKASSSVVSSGASAGIRNAGSKWETETLEVMSSGSLFVGDGGLVKALSSTLSDSASSTVTDAGSKWETDTFGVNFGSTLTVADGGFVDVNGLLSIQTMGQAFTTNGGRIEADELSVAFNGRLFSNSGFVGTSIPATGSVSSRGNAVVTGGGSQWNTSTLSVRNSSVLNVGNGGLVDVTDNLSIQSSARASTLGGFSDGRIEAGTLTLQNNGDLFSRSGFVGSSSTANGSVSSIGNALVTGFGSLWRSNTMEVSNNATLSVTDRAVAEASLNIEVKSGGQLLVNNATVQTTSINVVSDGALTLKAAVINADVNIDNASLTGTGIINGDVIGLGAKIGSGQSSGLLEIAGSFSQDIDSSLFFDLAGTIAESEYNVLSISGSAILAGELVVDFFGKNENKFSPSEGDVFDILYAEKLGGKFDLLTLAVLGGGLDWQVSYLFDEIGSTDVVRLSVIQTSAVPVPAAVWLFGSGLLGLIGVARRKQT